jgi:hypothetical protein
MVNELYLEDGPTEPGTTAELWPNGDYPPALAEDLRALVWCAQAKE